MSERHGLMQYAEQGAKGGTRVRFESAVEILRILRFKGEPQMQAAAVLAATDEPGGFGPGIHAIEARAVRAQECVFAEPRGEGCFARLNVNAGDGMHEAQNLARNVIGVGVLISAEADAQIGGLADIEQAVGVVEHQVDAGTFRDGFEEIGAEPLKQRLGMFKQSKLSLRHVF